MRSWLRAWSPFGEQGAPAVVAGGPLAPWRVSLASGLWLPIPFWFAAWLFLRDQGVVADVSPAVYAACLVFAWFLSAGARGWWPPQVGERALHLRVAAEVLAITPVTFAVGWGGVLSIAYLSAVPPVMRDFGSRATRPLLLWTAVAVACGQAAVAMEWVPVLLAQSEAHGLTAAALIGVAVSVLYAGAGARATERAEEELRASEQRFRALVQHSSDVVAVLEADGRIRWLSPSAETAAGIDPDAAAGVDVATLVHADDRLGVGQLLATLVAVPDRVARLHVRLAPTAGHWRWHEVVASNHLDDRGVQGIVADFRDVHDRKVMEEQLAYDASHDRLTGLLNRAGFLDRLEQAQLRARRRPRPVALLFLDLDGFKPVNDKLGHDVGDAVLREVADRLRACLRPEDAVGRFGGDEFTVLLEELPVERDALDVASRLVEAVGRPMAIGRPGDVRVSVSVGIAVDTRGETTSHELLRRADLAMYLAKRSGPARWQVFDEHGPWAVVELDRAARAPDRDTLA